MLATFLAVHFCDTLLHICSYTRGDTSSEVTDVAELITDPAAV